MKIHIQAERMITMKVYDLRSLAAAELYSTLPIEKQIEMNSMFTELQTALSVDLDLVTA